MQHPVWMEEENRYDPDLIKDQRSYTCRDSGKCIGNDCNGYGCVIGLGASNRLGQNKSYFCNLALSFYKAVPSNVPFSEYPEESRIFQQRKIPDERHFIRHQTKEC